MRRFLLGCAVLLVAVSAQAQDVDLTQGIAIVPSRAVQIEAGVLQTWDTADQTDLGGRLRVGLGGGLEVQAVLPSASWVDEATGLDDPALALKAALGGALGWDLAALAQVSLPIGGSLGDLDVEALALLIAERGLPGDIGLEIQAEAGYDPGSRSASGAGTVEVARAVTDRLDAALAVIGAVESFDLEAVLIQPSLVLRLTPVVQFDVFAGVGMAGDAAPDGVAGGGVYVRL